MRCAPGDAPEMPVMPVQRLRICYQIGGALSYASALDMGRLWERLLHRAHIPLCYSQGFNPHPRMQFASALAVGYTSLCEVLDIWLSQSVDSADALLKLRAQCPDGLYINDVAPVPLDEPSPQATLQTLGYRIEVTSSATSAAIEEAIRKLMDQTAFIYQRTRKGQTKDFNLRPFILKLDYVGCQNGHHILKLELAFKAEGSIRPEEVIQVLDIDVNQVQIQRIALSWGTQGKIVYK